MVGFCRTGSRMSAGSDGSAGCHRVQGPTPLEPGKSEHLPEKAELPGSDGIRSSQGDGEGAERDRMTSGPLP